jgi:hypothetical protein
MAACPRLLQEQLLTLYTYILNYEYNKVAQISDIMQKLHCCALGSLYFSGFVLLWCPVLPLILVVKGSHCQECLGNTAVIQYC